MGVTEKLEVFPTTPHIGEIREVFHAISELLLWHEWSHRRDMNSLRVQHGCLQRTDKIRPRLGEQEYIGADQFQLPIANATTSSALMFASHPGLL